MPSLTEVINKLDHFDTEMTIYVTTFSGASEAVVDFESDDGENPETAQGMKYFLEVNLAADVIRVWSEWREGKAPTLEEKIKAVIHYAENDSYLPADKA